MRLKSLTVVLILLGFLSAACGAQVQVETQSPATPLLATSTLPATPTRLPSETPMPPPQPTVAPVDGATSTQVNVRAQPSTGAAVLGIIPADTRVEITGKDPGESWWQINYPHPEAVDGKGWVTAQYVVATNADQVPVIGGGETSPGAGSMAVIQQQLNVRSGPGTDFDSLGTLNPQDAVNLTGKDANGAWLQIDYPPASEGRGWVNAAFVQAQGVEKLPIITEAGVIIGTGTPTSIPPTPTATVIPAWEDNDSPGNPIASVAFEPAGTRTLIYSGDLSSPRGDAADWIAFTPYGPYVFVSLECRGNGSVRMELMEATSRLNAAIDCGDVKTRITVNPGSNYLLHLQAVPATGDLQYLSYVLTVKTMP